MTLSVCGQRAGACMRSIFAIWSDNGRVDYGVDHGIARPRRLTFAARLGVAVVALAAAGMGARNVYSEMVANSKVHDNSGVGDSRNRHADLPGADRGTAPDAANAAAAPAINAGAPT